MILQNHTVKVDKEDGYKCEFIDLSVMERLTDKCLNVESVEFEFEVYLTLDNDSIFGYEVESKSILKLRCFDEDGFETDDFDEDFIKSKIFDAIEIELI